MGDKDRGDHLLGRRSRNMTPKQWMIIRTLVESRRKAITASPLDHRGHPRAELRYLDDYKAIVAEIDR
jgi:hypothetical protein